jgi:hypothetical protein
MAVALRKSRDDNENIIALVGGSDLVARMRAEQNAGLSAARSAQIAEVARLDREIEKAYPQAEAAVAAAVKRLKLAEAELLSAQRETQQAIGAKSNMSLVYTGRRDRLESELRQSAGAAVTEFCREMEDDRRRTSKVLRFCEERLINSVTGGTRVVCRSNRKSVHDRLNALRAATEAAWEIAVTEPDPILISQRLIALRTVLPPVSDDLVEQSE